MNTTLEQYLREQFQRHTPLHDIGIVTIDEHGVTICVGPAFHEAPRLQFRVRGNTLLAPGEQPEQPQESADESRQRLVQSLDDSFAREVAARAEAAQLQQQVLELRNQRNKLADKIEAMEHAYESVRNMCAVAQRQQSPQQEQVPPEHRAAWEWIQELKRVTQRAEAELQRVMQLPQPAPDPQQRRMQEQVTTCASCGQVKPTPIRNDTMGGYVCLTCVDKQLARLQQEQRATAEQVRYACPKCGGEAAPSRSVGNYYCPNSNCDWCGTETEAAMAGSAKAAKEGA